MSLSFSIVPYRSASFFFNDTATTEIYTLSLHDALPILKPTSPRPACGSSPRVLALASASRARSLDRKSTRLNSSHVRISYAVFCLKKKNIYQTPLIEVSNNIVVTNTQPVGAYRCAVCLYVFFFNDTATTEIYTLSLHDALPIQPREPEAVGSRCVCWSSRNWMRCSTRRRDRKSTRLNSSHVRTSYAVFCLKKKKKKKELNINTKKTKKNNYI